MAHITAHFSAENILVVTVSRLDNYKLHLSFPLLLSPLLWTRRSTRLSTISTKLQLPGVELRWSRSSLSSSSSSSARDGCTGTSDREMSTASKVFRWNSLICGMKAQVMLRSCSWNVMLHSWSVKNNDTGKIMKLYIHAQWETIAGTQQGLSWNCMFRSSQWETIAGADQGISSHMYAHSG